MYQNPSSVIELKNVVNSEYIKNDVKKVDLDNLEKKFMGKLNEQPSSDTNTQNFDQMMNQLMSGIDDNKNNHEQDDEFLIQDDDEFIKLTNEQRTSKQINYAMNKLGEDNVLSGSTNFSFESEKEEEEKLDLLDAIDLLRSQIEADGMSITHIKQVDRTSSITEIRNIYHILNIKNMRRTYCSTAETAITSLILGLEYLFDGKKKYGPYSPDLTGWHNTVKVKLKNMRYETSSLVYGVVNQYNISPIWRIVLELVPSAFLHSHMRSRRKKTSTYSTEEIADAIDQIDKNNMKNC
jgi:hypothetical protein